MLSVVKAWVGEMPRAPYVSTETIAHGTICHVIAVVYTRAFGTVICLYAFLCWEGLDEA